MSDRPVFIYAATYASYDDCLADYELLLEAHAAKLVGTYDVALIRKDNEGKIHVEKHEKPTQHGAWGGIAVGALVGVLFAPLVLGAAAVGGLAGGIGGHLKKGMSRDDATELGELLEDGQSALVVIGESRVGRAARQGAHAGGKVDREGNRRRRRGARARTQGVRKDLPPWGDRPRQRHLQRGGPQRRLSGSSGNGRGRAYVRADPSWHGRVRLRALPLKPRTWARKCPERFSLS